MINPAELEKICIENKVRIDQEVFLRYNLMAKINIFKFVSFNNLRMKEFQLLWIKKFEQIMAQ